jgi:hypothetical protein
LCGQAISHVVRRTLQDLVDFTTQAPNNIKLLLNCKYSKAFFTAQLITHYVLCCEGTSVVDTFSDEAEDFVIKMSQRGVSVVAVDEDCRLCPVNSDEEIKSIMGRSATAAAARVAASENLTPSSPTKLRDISPQADISMPATNATGGAAPARGFARQPSGSHASPIVDV